MLIIDKEDSTLFTLTFVSWWTTIKELYPKNRHKTSENCIMIVTRKHAQRCKKKYLTLDIFVYSSFKDLLLDLLQVAEVKVCISHIAGEKLNIPINLCISLCKQPVNIQTLQNPSFCDPAVALMIENSDRDISTPSESEMLIELQNIKGWVIFITLAIKGNL